MRTSHLVSVMAVLAASASVSAHSLALMESFDTSILDARAAMPNTVPMLAQPNNDSRVAKRKDDMVKLVRRRGLSLAGVAAPAVVKRGEEADADEDCEEEEEDDDDNDNDNNDDEEEDCEENDGDSQGDDNDDGEDCDEEPAQDGSNKTLLANTPVVNAVTPKPTGNSKASPNTPSAASDKTSSVSKPSNLANKSFTPAEGCIRYHTVLDGEVCLGVLDGSKDLGLTLDQFYCLNPGLNEECGNLSAGLAYCTGYSGTWPSQ